MARLNRKKQKGRYKIEEDEAGNVQIEDTSVPSNRFTKMTTSDLQNAFSQFYDFEGDKFTDYQKRFASGRPSNWARRFDTPEVTNFNFNPRKATQKGYRGSQDTGFNQHPFSISAVLLDQSPEVLKRLLDMEYQRTPRKLESNKSIIKRLGLEGKTLSPADRMQMKKVDEKKLEQEFAKLKKNPNYKGHAADVTLVRELLNMPELTSNQVDLIAEQLKSAKFKDAIVAKYPEFEKDATEGKAPYRKRSGTGGRSGEFINAPLNYQMNLEASNIKGRPSEEWLNIQNISNQGATEDGTGGFDKREIVEILSKDDEFFSGLDIKRGDLQYDPEIAKVGRENPLYNFGVKYDKESGRHFSEGSNRFLTPEEEKTYRNAASNKYINDSGWTMFEPTSGIEPTPSPTSIDPGIKQPLDVIESVTGMPEVKEPVVGTATPEFPSMKFQDDDDDPVGDFLKEDESIDAVVESLLTGKNVDDKSEYTAKDLERDKKIIEDTYGKSAAEELQKKIDDEKEKLEVLKRKQDDLGYDDDDDDDDDSKENIDEQVDSQEKLLGNLEDEQTREEYIPQTVQDPPEYTPQTEDITDDINMAFKGLKMPKYQEGGKDFILMPQDEDSQKARQKESDFFNNLYKNFGENFSASDLVLTMVPGVGPLSKARKVVKASKQLKIPFPKLTKGTKNLSNQRMKNMTPKQQRKADEKIIDEIIKKHGKDSKQYKDAFNQYSDNTTKGFYMDIPKKGDPFYEYQLR
mgnify:CR=1 FL=1|tara:strand:+ start:379 stop:2610 length:2232 start_codon:yes stop_codon:yes gene_type:complete